MYIHIIKQDLGKKIQWNLDIMKAKAPVKYYVPYIEVLFQTSHLTFTGVKIIGRYTEDFVIQRLIILRFHGISDF